MDEHVALHIISTSTKKHDDLAKYCITWVLSIVECKHIMRIDNVEFGASFPSGHVRIGVAILITSGGIVYLVTTSQIFNHRGD